MNTLINTSSKWINAHFVTLILAFSVGGFLFILVELLLEQHWRGIQLVAPISAAIGLVLGLLALLGRRGVPVIALFLLLSATGLFGTFQHFEGRTSEGPAERAQTTLQPVSVTFSGYEELNDYQDSDEDEGPPSGAGGRAPPWLAPLSLSGLALLGAVGTLAGKDDLEARADES